MNESHPWVMLAGGTVVVGNIAAVAVLPVAAVVLIFLLGVAAGIYLLGELANRRWRDLAPPERWVAAARIITATALGCVAAVGILAQFGGLGALCLLVVGVCSPPVLAQIAKLPALTVRWPSRRGQDASAADPTPARAASAAAREPISLSDADLCRQWVRTYTELQRAEPRARRAEVIAERSELLIELERRDPAGFARWIASGARAASNPQRFLSSTVQQAQQDPPAL